MPVFIQQDDEQQLFKSMQQYIKNNEFLQSKAGLLKHQDNQVEKENVKKNWMLIKFVQQYEKKRNLITSEEKKQDMTNVDSINERKFTKI